MSRRIEGQKQEQNQKTRASVDKYLEPKFREKRFEIRFSNDEFEQVRIAFAERTQYSSLAQYCREVLLDASSKEKPLVTRQELLQEYMKVQSELKRIGSNINQIARAANTKPTAAIEVADLKRQVEEALKINNEVLKKVFGRK